MKISVTQYDRVITIEDPNGDEYTIDEFIENVVAPLMCGMEYSQESVSKRLNLD